MIGIDTNVIVRYIMQDDLKQSPKANRFFESLSADTPGFISQISIVELVWVLGGSYDLNRQQISQALDTLLRTTEVVVDRAGQVLKALRAYKSSAADFADCLIASVASGAGCETTVTFDVRATKGAGMTLLA